MGISIRKFYNTWITSEVDTQSTIQAVSKLFLDLSKRVGTAPTEFIDSLVGIANENDTTTNLSVAPNQLYLAHIEILSLVT